MPYHAPQLISHAYLPFLCPHCMCTSRALALCALSFQSRERMADVAVPRAPHRRPPAGAPSPAPVVSPLASTCWQVYQQVLSPPARMSTPGSGPRGLRESVLTIDSDRARPLSGGFVNHYLKRGHVLTSQRRVAATSTEHAKHIFFRFDSSHSLICLRRSTLYFLQRSRTLLTGAALDQLEGFQPKNLKRQICRTVVWLRHAYISTWNSLWV
eukprot:6177539-Pleurochrysis_carterae.AAC.7